MPKDVLATATHELLGSDLADMPLDRLYSLIQLTQHATNLLLDEIERRGELAFRGSLPVKPYMSDYSGPTVSAARSAFLWKG